MVAAFDGFEQVALVRFAVLGDDGLGILELNRNPENFYAEVEQAAFNPMNIVEGIGFSPGQDAARTIFSYGDAQRYRLGVNHNLIPVNKPRCPFHAYHRDGQMRTDDNYGATTPYEPNSYGEWQDSAGPQGAAPGRRRRGLQLRRARIRRRLLHAAGQAVAADDARRSAGDMRKHGARHGQRHVRNCSARAQLLQRRSVVRRRRGPGTWASASPKP